jgi:hypothetical protein
VAVGRGSSQILPLRERLRTARSKSATIEAKLDPIAPIAQHEQVTYATQRLTKALQDLIARSTEVPAAPQSIAAKLKLELLWADVEPPPEEA